MTVQQVLVISHIGFALTLIGCTKQKNLYDLELEAAESLAPSQTFSEEKTVPSAALKQLKLSVHLDKQCYRRNTCKARVRNVIKRASRHVEREFGVAFLIHALQEWAIDSAEGNLVAPLRALRQVEADENSDWIVGIVSGTGLARSTRHDVGMSVRMGRHFVISLRDNPEEWNQLQAQYQTLSHLELGKVYEQRRVHREVSIFLHEWGHSLGALHTTDAHFFMFPLHEFVSTSFGPANADLIMLGLRMRGEPDARQGAMTWKKAVLERLSKETPTSWDPRDQEAARQTLHAEVVEGKIILEPGDVEPFNQAVALAQEGKSTLR